MRGPAISDIEKDIQKRADKKDNSLKIVGLKKEYVGNYQGFKIYKIDSEWIRNNLDVNFGSGGHGRVHSFIPKDEIWIENKRGEEYNSRTIIHEINEYKKMAKLPFYHAHKNSMKEEFKHSAEQKLLLKKLNKKGNINQRIATAQR